VKKEPSAGDVALSNIGNYLGLPSLGGIGLAAGMTETEFRQRLYVAIDRKGKGLLPVLADAPDLTLRGAALAPDSAQLFISFGFNHLRFYDEVLEPFEHSHVKKMSHRQMPLLPRVKPWLGLKSEMNFWLVSVVNMVFLSMSVM
ncbi:MAG TPA: hypothetical protein PKE58_23780, partial [Acidobacteriota bacterium]|nr:hypothetical protein [Acidobacteriota bacterium]